MKLKSLKKFDVKDYELSKTIGWIREFLDQLMPNLFIKGEMIDVAVTTSGVATNHGLASIPNGWLVVDITGNATVWRTAWDDKRITLQSSSNVTVKVWVF